MVRLRTCFCCGDDRLFLEPDEDHYRIAVICRCGARGSFCFGFVAAVLSWNGVFRKEDVDTVHACVDPEKMHGAADGFGGSDY